MVLVVVLLSDRRIIRQAEKMKIQKDFEILEKQLEKRVKARQKRKKRKMAVSGKSVFRLQRIIRKRNS